jgi:hypothetical protein
MRRRQRGQRWAMKPRKPKNRAAHARTFGPALN